MTRLHSIKWKKDGQQGRKKRTNSVNGVFSELNETKGEKPKKDSTKCSFVDVENITTTAL
jgi:hypothetical protein